MVKQQITVIAQSANATIYQIGSKRFTFSFGDDGRLNKIEASGADAKLTTAELLQIISQPILSWENMKPWSVPRFVQATPLISTGPAQQPMNITIPPRTVWKILGWSAENIDRYLNCAAYLNVQGFVGGSGQIQLFSSPLSCRTPTWGVAVWNGVAYSRTLVGTGFYGSQVGDRLFSGVIYQEAAE